MRVEDGLRRSRLTTLFRFPLSAPHFVWLTGWSVLALLAAFAAWVAALVVGRTPRPLHRFLAAYVRYSSHVTAFATVVGNPFPGFVGREGSYPVDIAIDGPTSQRRLVTLFRLFLAVPALLVANALWTVLFVIAFFLWPVALIRGLGPARAARTRRDCDPVRRPDERLPAARHRALPRCDADVAAPSAGAGGGTGVSGRRAAEVALLAVLAVVWVVAAALLWRTQVPDDLTLPEIDLSEHFSARELSRAADFERFLRIHFLLSQLVLLLTLLVWVWRGPRYTRESAAGPIGTGILLGMLGLGVVWLTQLPFAITEIWWLRRYDLLRTGWAEALLTHYLELSGEFLGIALTLLIVVGFARWLGERWWLAAAPAFVALAAFFAFVFPYLGDTERLEGPAAPQRGARHRPRAGARRRQGRRRGGGRGDPGAERLRDGLRPDQARRPLGHAARLPG